MAFRRAFAAALLLPFLGAPVSAMEQSVYGGQPVRTTEILLARTGALSAREQQALSFRHLQTELMVAALSCGQPTYRSKYNDFVIRFRPHLWRNGRTLHGIFARTYGRQGKRRLDDYMTKLANEFSIRSMVRADFCPLAGRKLDVVLSVGRSVTAGALLQRADNL